MENLIGLLIGILLVAFGCLMVLLRFAVISAIVGAALWMLWKFVLVASFASLPPLTFFQCWIVTTTIAFLWKHLPSKK